VTDLAKADASLPLFAAAVAEGGIVKVLRLPGGGGLSRAELDSLEEVAKSFGARGLARAKVAPGGEWTQSPLAKGVSPALRQAINARAEAAEGDILLFQFGKAKVVNGVLGQLRVQLGKKLKLIPEGRDAFLWVVDFPLFDYSDEQKAFVASHHPFTSPRPEDVPHLLTDPGRARAVAYDLVLNGNEVGGAASAFTIRRCSRRSSGRSASTRRKRSPNLASCSRRSSSAPPRTVESPSAWTGSVMLLTGGESLRDVIPYPKTQHGTDLMTGAPGDVSAAQLLELHVKSTAS